MTKRFKALLVSKGHAFECQAFRPMEEWFTKKF